ncbi:hypothetical protein OH799_05245 [Nocardia sp. NBC_00881]|nr:hypothetical protein OH799_05245 [Nocardia sp. NBC_00881]
MSRSIAVGGCGFRHRGHYAFHLPDLGGTGSPLRDPDARDDD